MQNFEQRGSARFLSQPLDRSAITLMVVLAIATAVLLLGGDHASPKVRQFSWQDKQVGAEDKAFILTFSRPMNQASVEEHLQITPPLPGKISWAGRRMAYTLESSIPYGTPFEVTLANALDRFANPDDNRTIQPFTGRFRSRDRAFVYLGSKGEEEGRLVLENLTRQDHRLLTPANLVVMEYEPYPLGDRILFSATERDSIQQGQLNQKLYTVTTGLQPNPPTDALSAQSAVAIADETQPGLVEQLLDSQDYQNLKFDLSPDGSKIIVQRVNRKDPSDFGIWLIDGSTTPQRIETEPGGDFLIAPDSNSLAMSQGQGLAILPLESGAEPLDFLGKFGKILSFSSDGTAAATVQFNAEPNNPTRSLFVVTNQGTEKELVETSGSILSAEFDPMKQFLYALVTKRLPSDDVFLEQPYLVAINLATDERLDLLELPVQRQVEMSLSPDGLGILFDQVVSASPEQSAPGGVVQGSDGSPVLTSRLWFLPLLIDRDGTDYTLTLTEPESLPIDGLRPRWLP